MPDTPSSVRALIGAALLAFSLTACPNSDFALSAPPDPINVQRGSSVTATIGINRMDGFNGAVTLELTNPPMGVTAPSLTVPSSSSSGQLILNLAPGLAPGLLELTVTGSSLGKTKNAALKLNVTAPAPDFTIGPQNNPTVTQGESALLSVKLERKAGFDGPVTVDVQNPPAGISASPVTFASGVSSGTLAVGVAASAQPGPVALTVRGVADGVTRTATANLTVVAAQDFTVRITGSPSITSPQDRTISVPISITRLGGFAGEVQLALEGEGVGSGADKLEATLAPNPVPGAASATTLQLKIGPNVPAKPYDLTVRALSAGQNRTAALRLEVQPPLVVLGLPTVPLQRIRGLTTVPGVSVSLTRASGFTGPVELSVQAPNGIRVGISPNPATGNSLSMFVQPEAQAPLGPNTVRVSTTNLGDRNVSASFSVDVLQPDFTIQVSNPADPSASALTLPSGAGLLVSKRSLNVSVANPQNGFDDPVLFDVTGLPAGASVQRVNVTPGGVGALEITLDSSVRVGSYPITITGSHPGLSTPKAVPFTLNVEAGERMYETVSYSGGNLPNGWGTNKNSSGRDLWIKDGGALFAYANRAGAGNKASLTSTTFLTPAMGFPCNGSLELRFTSFFGSTGSGQLRVLVLNSVTGTPIEVGRPSYVANGVFRLETFMLDKTYLSSGDDGRLIFEFTPSSSNNTEFWGVDNILIACR